MPIFTAEAIKPQLESWPLLHFYYKYTQTYMNSPLPFPYATYLLLANVHFINERNLIALTSFKSKLKYLMNTVAKLTHTSVRSFSNDWHSLLGVISNVSHIS